MNEDILLRISDAKAKVHEFFIQNTEASFITITLKPKLYKYSSITQLELSNNTLFTYLYKASKDFICVAEHTEAGNIHYHACYVPNTTFSTIMLANTFKKDRLFGFIKIDNHIKDVNRASEYMTKDLYNTIKIMTGNHKPYYFMHYKEWDEIINFYRK